MLHNCKKNILSHFFSSFYVLEIFLTYPNYDELYVLLEKISLRSVATTSKCTFRLLYNRDLIRIQFFSRSSFYICLTMHEQHFLVIKANEY